MMRIEPLERKRQNDELDRTLIKLLQQMSGDHQEYDDEDFEIESPVRKHPSPKKEKEPEAADPPKQHGKALSNAQEADTPSTPKGKASDSPRKHRVVSRAAPSSRPEKQKKPSSLFALAYHGDVKGLERALQEGASIMSLDRHGWSILHWGCSRGHVNVIQFVLHASATSGGDADDGDETKDGEGVADLINKPDQLNGWTPLHVSCIGGHQEAVRVLLAANADPNIKDLYGDKPVDCLPKDNKRIRGWLTGSLGLNDKEPHSDDETKTERSDQDETKGKD